LTKINKQVDSHRLPTVAVDIILAGCPMGTCKDLGNEKLGANSMEKFTIITLQRLGKLARFQPHVLSWRSRNYYE
jgi:hypothetical protein